jgi:hypothetical protein
MARAGGNGAGERKGPPEGFRKRTADSGAPWFLKEVGAVCYGLLEGRFEMTGGEQGGRAYYQVRLKEPCKGTIGKGEDAEIVELRPGDLVNLNENYKIEVLREDTDVIKRGGAVEVWAHFVKKINIGGGQTMWDIEVYTQIVRAPTVLSAASAPSSETADPAENDGIPF